ARADASEHENADQHDGRARNEPGPAIQILPARANRASECTLVNGDERDQRIVVLREGPIRIARSVAGAECDRPAEVPGAVQRPDTPVVPLVDLVGGKRLLRRGSLPREPDVAELAADVTAHP